MKNITVVLSFVFLSVLFIQCSSSKKENIEQSFNKPNILLINIDDMGWRDVGFMGSEYYETPNIDELAAGGMIFTNAYAS
ncbi:MAG: sulfatase-like hydrolase/transferase, partial [Prolixibacteraceae bacterium]|nr:sulfatase-like hydrolase/transferase [Prolixibacteraceae bacterium]